MEGDIKFVRGFSGRAGAGDAESSHGGWRPAVRWHGAELPPVFVADEPFQTFGIELQIDIATLMPRPHIQLGVIQTDLAAAVHAATDAVTAEVSQHPQPVPMGAFPPPAVGPVRVLEIWIRCQPRLAANARIDFSLQPVFVIEPSLGVMMGF